VPQLVNERSAITQKNPSLPESSFDLLVTNRKKV